MLGLCELPAIKQRIPFMAVRAFHAFFSQAQVFISLHCVVQKSYCLFLFEYSCPFGSSSRPPGSRAEAQLLSLRRTVPPAIQEIALVVALDHEVVVTAAS